MKLSEITNDSAEEMIDFASLILLLNHVEVLNLFKFKHSVQV